MREFVLILAAIAIVAHSEDQTRQDTQKKMAYALPAFDADPNRVHSSANLFVHHVGTLLKHKYPSRVENLKVKFSFSRNKRGESGFSLLWSCVISPAKPENADYFFDRRGSISPNLLQASSEAGKKAWEMRLDFQKSYNDYRDLGSVSQSAADSTGRTYYLEEHFGAAKKIELSK